MYLDSGMGRVSFFQEALEKIYSKILTELTFIMVENVMTNYGRLCVKKKLERQRTAANENQKNLARNRHERSADQEVHGFFCLEHFR